MQRGSLVVYHGNIYEISEFKSDNKGYWVKFNENPESNLATACTGMMSECWYRCDYLEPFEE